MRVGVFCSANSGLDPQFYKAADAFGQGLARRGWEMIYGGATVGLMGRFADSCVANKAVVRGALTRGLAASREMPHEHLTELVIVEDLFDRKRWMNDHSDAFAIFPGGLGTLDEALEVITWKSLGYHDKPIVFVNLGGFWHSQLEAFRDLESRGVIRKGGLDLYQVADDLEGLWSILDGKSSVR
ncbi:MAG TPA: TIGR00730 family Rossman fold protein [Bdellovibrionales bacterium]|nr:TIGR00730 family Rossman fold protein [Bdellovibrionales bacterium]